jgi:alginate O-acetyltransferase complex protein AlgI
MRLALYILMFPQLIAGPILRFRTVAQQLRERTVTTENDYHELVLFCLGMGQKVLLADTLAGICDPLFGKWQSLSAAAAWLAAISYALQLYFDFSGYSNMAIGLG